MIFFLVLLLLLVTVQFVFGGGGGGGRGFEHQDNNYVEQEIPSSFPVRVKRDILSMGCPRDAANIDYFVQDCGIFIYSRNNDRKNHIINYGNDGWSSEKMKTLAEDGFNSTKPTIIFVHGFHQSAWSPWLMDVRSIYDTIFSIDNDNNNNSIEPSFNLILFDWSSYPQYRYWSTVSYIPHLGRVLGEFLSQLSKTQSYEVEKLHLIAYSLSTHIIGLAGRYVANNYGKTIGRLTALDPTGVCFQDGTQFDEENALRSTDAKLVVARHYNMDGLGAKRFIGGLNILINGSRDQPRNDEDFPGAKHIHDTNIFVMAGQDHHRATEHETHAASDGQCHQFAYECENYEAYLRGECADCGQDGSKCYLINDFNQIVGTGNRQKELGELNSDVYAPGARMFLRTHHREPYCLHHYQLIAHLNSNVSTATKALLSSGLVDLDFGSSHLTQLQAQPNEDGRFTALASSETKIQSPEAIILKAVDGTITETFLKSLDHIEMDYMSNSSSDDRAKAPYKICSNYVNNSLIECPTQEQSRTHILNIFEANYD